MANPQAPQFSPPPYVTSPHPTSPLTQMGPFPPPNKRPRLSPDVQSPYVSPQMTNGSLPNSGFSTPYYGPHTHHTNGVPMKHAPDHAPQTPITGVMGPPSRPTEEKPADLNDLSDVLHSAGINIRDEEAVLTSFAFSPRPGSSFSQDIPGSAGLQPGYFDQAGYNTLSPNFAGGRDSFYGGGTFNQPAVAPQVLEEKADAARKDRIRKKNALRQYELNDPFLAGRAVWFKLEKSMKSQHIGMPDGPSAVPSNEQFVRDIQAHGPVDSDHLARVQDQLLVKSAGTATDAITLLSLAAKHRIRAILEDACTLAKGRRASAHGIVPPDLVDLAVGRGDPVSTTLEDSPEPQSLKRSYSKANELPTPVSESHSSPVKTIAFPNVMARRLLKVVQADRAREEARAEKRNKRNANGLLSNDQSSRSGSVSGAAGGIGTPKTPGGDPPPDSVAPKKALTKKEQKRQADMKASEAQQHAATSSSLKMALGGGSLFGGKKISWMTSKQPASDTGFVPPSRLTMSSQKPSSAAKSASNAAAATKGIGDFREDKETGKGVQLRDLVAILEPDLREKKSLARAYGKLNNNKK